MTARFDAEFPAYAEQRLAGLPFAESVSVTSETTVEQAGNGKRYDWKESIVATATADKAFDSLSDRSIYENLESFHDQFFEAWLKYVKEELPEHRDYTGTDSKISRGKPVLHFLRAVVVVQTPENTYQSMGNIRDYFELNGKDYFLASHTAPAPKPAVSNGIYHPPSEESPDPYNASEYATSEDFYDDHYDDFFNYEDAEDYYMEHEYD